MPEACVREQIALCRAQRGASEKRMHMHMDDLLREAHEHPNAEKLGPSFRAQYVLDGKDNAVAFEGPLGPAICRNAQRIDGAAALSANERRTLPLFP
jgi:hypothetical protein